LLAAVPTLGIGFSSVRLSFVAGPPRGSAFIGGNSDRVGDESSSKRRVDRSQRRRLRRHDLERPSPVGGAEESRARKGAICARGVCGRGEV